MILQNIALDIRDDVLVKCYGVYPYPRLPRRVRRIGEKAFYRCRCLEGIVIPDSVTAIGAQAFADCRDLMYVSIPASVTEIDPTAFVGCKLLRTANIFGKEYDFRFCGVPEDAPPVVGIVFYEKRQEQRLAKQRAAEGFQPDPYMDEFEYIDSLFD